MTRTEMWTTPSTQSSFVNITVTDINEPPAFEGLYVRVAVKENTAASTNVGDPDPGR